MKENAIYFAKNSLYELIRATGGDWGDAKERPVVCLLQDKSVQGLYWAIPMGAWDHRNYEGKSRIEKFLNRPNGDIASCYYHIGRTTRESIFFISDAFPITKKYIEREYLGYDSQPYVIKNPKLISELTRKLNRILYYEDRNPNSFRQHITAVKNHLIIELRSEREKTSA